MNCPHCKQHIKYANVTQEVFGVCEIKDKQLYHFDLKEFLNVVSARCPHCDKDIKELR
jgi:uncharacterized protein with PIN domain